MLKWLKRGAPPTEAPPAPPAAAPPADPDELMRQAFPLHEAGNIEGARQLYQEILRIRPDYADAHYLLGRIEQDAGHDDLAIPHFRNALRANNKDPHFHRSLAEAYFRVGYWQESAAYFHNVVELDPQDFESWTNLACAHERLGRLAEATQYFEKALQLQQDSPQAINNVAMSLKDRGRVDEAIARFRRAREIAPEHEDVFNNYLYTLNFSTRHSAAEVFQAHAEFDRYFGSGRFAPLVPRAANPDPERRLRIAYFSPDLRSHPISIFLMPLLERHDRAQVEVFCYHLHPWADVVTQRLQGLADHWVECRGLDDEALAARIVADGIDILVDLAGHTGSNRLPVLGRKPAPVIATWLGYPNTTGLRTVDWFITDATCNPPGTEPYYTEALWRLPAPQWCFTPPDVPAPLSPLPAAGDGHVRFGSFNHASKLTDEMLRVWAQLLRQVPDSSLLVWGVGAEQSAHIRDVMAAAGADPQRLEFSDRTALPAQLALYQRIDVTLDTFPYNGTTTTFNSLWMGVPVLSLSGSVHASRTTLSILTALGLEDWCTHTPDELVALAVRKLGDLRALAELRAGLRARMEASPLMAAPQFARQMEAAYREMWRRHCAAPAPG